MYYRLWRNFANHGETNGDMPHHASEQKGNNDGHSHRPETKVRQRKKHLRKTPLRKSQQTKSCKIVGISCRGRIKNPMDLWCKLPREQDRLAHISDATEMPGRRRPQLCNTQQIFPTTKPLPEGLWLPELGFVLLPLQLNLQASQDKAEETGKLCVSANVRELPR